jgi:hypothetical protein
LVVAWVLAFIKRLNRPMPGVIAGVVWLRFGRGREDRITVIRQLEMFNYYYLFAHGG